MFSWKTGWFAVAVSVLGALTASDTLPLITAFVDGIAGAHAAQVLGSFLTVAGAIVAKLSHSTKPDAPPAP